MILVIDTSSRTAAVALLGESPQEYTVSARSQELLPLLRRLAAEHTVTRVAVAAGPGSFTGLRVGVSFGLGLAVGLKIPIVPLPSLALQAARSDRPVTAVVEAGRGRFYFQAPDGEAMLGDPADVPTAHPIVGRLSPEAEAALRGAGYRLVPESELRTFAIAAAILLETANEVAYGSLEIEYMQSFRARG
jgi:tRNA threonylcarbamoyladenosine biosynthesis protein TsaB